MSVELKPCPFCGGNAIQQDGFVECTNIGCNAVGPDEAGSCKKWNTRATQPPAVGLADLHAEIEVLRRAVRTGISVITESCAPRGNPDIDDAGEISAALHDMRAVLPDPLADLEAQP